MAPQTLFVPCLLAAFAAVGPQRCGGHGSWPHHGGHSGHGGHGGSGGDDGGVACDVGSQTEGRIGARGGVLELCGARIAIAAGTLTSPRTVRLTLVTVPDDAPVWLEPAGAAFTVDVEGGLPASAAPPLSVLVPHAPTTRSLYFYRHDPDAGYQPIEACTVTDEQIGQELYVDGTFVALMDREDFPDSVDGLGSGTIDATLQGEQRSYDLDEGFATYAIYDEALPGEWNVTLSVAQAPSDDELRRVLIKLAVAADGSASLIELTYGSTADGGFWGYLPFDPAPPAVSVTRTGQQLAGSIEVEVRRGDESAPLSLQFNVTVDKFRFPPELACSFPEG